jgi:hypothetical protein
MHDRRQLRSPGRSVQGDPIADLQLRISGSLLSSRGANVADVAHSAFPDKAPFCRLATT